MSSKPILSFIAVVLLVGCKSQPRNPKPELASIKRATPLKITTCYLYITSSDRS